MVSEVDPTTQTSPDVRASTPFNAVPVGARKSIETQPEPFQCRTSGAGGTLWMSLVCEPTAQTVLPVAATPERLLMLVKLPSGVDSRVHEVPFQ